MTGRPTMDTPEEPKGAEQPAEAEEPESPADSPTEVIREVPVKEPEPVWAAPLEVAEVATPQAQAATVPERVDLEATGLTISDGFRFGCGFVLALAIGTLAFLVLLTAMFAVGALLGFKLPF